VTSGIRALQSRAELEETRTAADDVLAFTAGMDDVALAALPDADRRTFRALQDALAEISERVGRLPSEILARHPAVDWRGWAGLRDVLPRQRAAPGFSRLHPVIVHDLPTLLAALEAELADGASGSE
jgi:uncharacterized protein with HEPN domain